MAFIGVEQIKVTKEYGRTWENLEGLYFIRDHAERRSEEHMMGHGVDPDVWAAVNTPDEAWQPAPGYTPPPAEWKELKAEWHRESAFLVALREKAHQMIRIATGHEKIKDLVV